MKKSTKLAALLLASSMLASCAGSLVNLKYENGQFYNKRLGVVYNVAPTNYQPRAIGDAYGYYKDSDMTLYQITGADPKEWLSQELAGSATSVFYSEDITLPTLEELGTTAIYLCTNTEVSAAVAVIEDEAVISEVIDLFVNGKEAEWPLLGSELTLDIKFYSADKYPHLYYNLFYGEFPEGKFLYDRNTKHCVEVGDIFLDYVG
ncbi:MAG: hypothetical protein IJ037_05455 [Clostridia bacterium]|nr:hypothetical protein [Clostridia bacterium]MBQ8368519.1 hypothetical protein [Clostridia bacterium]MBQ8513140.1 hypothetical protein [Clostridia bacterium]